MPVISDGTDAHQEDASPNELIHQTSNIGQVRGWEGAEYLSCVRN